MLVTLATAKQHLRVDGTDSDADITQKILAAEAIALKRLQCNVYVDDAALAAAVAAVPATVAAAKAAYIVADDLADAIVDEDVSKIEKAQAFDIYMRALFAANMTRNGIVFNSVIEAAILLIVGWLFESREDGSEVPKAARDLLDIYRCYS